MTPTGLVRVRQRFLARIVALYALLIVLAIALPALALQPRDRSPHPMQEEVTQQLTRMEEGR